MRARERPGSLLAPLQKHGQRGCRWLCVGRQGIHLAPFLGLRSSTCQTHDRPPNLGCNGDTEARWVFQGIISNLTASDELCCTSTRLHAASNH